MYAEYLRVHGYLVTEVSSTDAALPLVSEADAVITGLMVRGQPDPIEFIRTVRAQWSAKPIVVVTASAFTDRRESAHRAGADVVLLKPCLPDVLLRELRDAIEAKNVRLMPNEDRS